MQLNNTSLYIHIPFCRKKCDYCDFFSVPRSLYASKPDFYTLYVRSLLNEISYYVKHYSVKGWNSVYIGGGTPSTLNEVQLKILLDGVFRLARKTAGCEVTLEMNGEDAEESYVINAAECGVTRLSLGIQVLDDEVLKKCGRVCTKEKALRALDIIKKNWQGRLSVDFIAGLPGCSYETLEKSMKTALTYPVDHVSLYSLMVEEGTPLEKNIRLGKVSVDDDQADEMWMKGRDFLEKNGFSQYEVSNFARKGCESVHNTTYWKLKSYIGCGPGACGTVYEDELRWNNKCDIDSYVSFFSSGSVMPDNRVCEPEKIDVKIQQFEFFMMGLRLTEGVCENDYHERFGCGFPEAFMKEFAVREKQSLAFTYEADGKKYFTLGKKGILFLNSFLEALLREEEL